MLTMLMLTMLPYIVVKACTMGEGDICVING